MDNFQNNRIEFGLKDKIIYGTTIVLILAFIVSLGYFLSALAPMSKTSEMVRIEIKSGQSFQEIARDLNSAKVIRSVSAFQLLSLISGSAHKLKPGVYFLDPSWSAPGILGKIVKGPELERTVVIPEGMTLLDIDKKLSDTGILPAKALANFNFDSLKNNYEFLKSWKTPIKIEGYLFPDTYKFYVNAKPEDVARKMLDNFEIKAWPVLKTNNQRLTTYDVLKIASLIEREVYFSEEKPMVAGIIYKRLKIGMGLQIDASIIYGKCGGLVTYCQDSNFYRKDTEFVSPYNTYLYKGLTPTPISNPGLDSIKAALNPISTDYLYYLSDPVTHKLIFSKTLDEHNENRVKYLNI